MKLILANTEVNYFGNQLVAFYLERHAIGASTHKGTESRLDNIRNYPAPARLLVNGDGGIVAIGILSAERAKEIVRTAKLESSWDPSSIPGRGDNSITDRVPNAGSLPSFLQAD
jgi:hypothetical protein